MSDTHAQTTLYVRESMLPPSDPPSTQVGVIKWMRENLFSGWVNTLLTVVSLYVIFATLKVLLPWFFGSVWTASSLTECREVLSVAAADLAHGAGCGAVISDRWLQLIFGFYKSELYWRPILAFVLLFVALAPVLFSARVPRQMLWFSAIYPFLATWLLWGGSFWLPILAFAGFVVAGLCIKFVSPRVSPFAGIVAGVSAAILWWAVAMPAINNGLHKMVGSARIDAVTAQATETLTVVPERIKEIQAEQNEINARVRELDARKDVVLAEIEAAQEAGTEPAEALVSEFDSLIATLLDERRAASALGLEIFRMQQAQTEDRTLLNNINSLPEWEAALPVARQTAKELKADLPASVRGLAAVGQADEDTSNEDIQALTAALDAENTAESLQRNINGAYGRLGLTGLEPVTSREFGGFMLAMIIGIAGIVLSLPLGILLALGRQSDLMIVKGFSVAFIEVIRGVPLIVWLFVASLLLTYFLPPGTNFDLVLRVIIMVTLFSAAYIAEVVRGGLAALPKGQYEAADALGLDYWKSMRLIVLPQALKISIPGIVNTFIGLFKDTTLVGIIGLLDPLGLSNSIRASSEWNGIYWELFIFIGLMFFVSCFAMGRYSLWLEKKLQRGHR